MSTVTTHVLDLSRGCPAAGLEVILCKGEQEIGRSRTNTDGRITGWDAGIDAGAYRLRFETKAWFQIQSIDTFYPFVEIHFEVAPDKQYHIPLLLSPWGYSTYRGS